MRQFYHKYKLSPTIFDQFIDFFVNLHLLSNDNLKMAS